ncbi:hypothetical protein TrLO_g10259 [Triparma laevis f. longispina]|uniref:UmuC domain-containing protein n=1 Tax=Triparma laevis f. longispina TaxID=1714387 RepID=A0A9W7EEL5_9STRA|nr:hypothetical protein TrLO_g10259 [Triparma laevis f. longispina]
MSMNHLVVYASGKSTDAHRAKIDEIILRLSCNSTYFKEQVRKDNATNSRILKLTEMVKLSPLLSRSVLTSIDEKVTTLRSTRRPHSYHVVVDMDAFYFSCHVADMKTRGNLDCLVSYPKGSKILRKIQEIPAAVGGGVVTTSNYAARKYGVRSAMAGFIANQLVIELGKNNGDTELHWVEKAEEGNGRLYSRLSGEVRGVLLEYDPDLKCYSLDECYMHLEGYVNLRYGGMGMSHEEIQKVWEKRRKGREESSNDDDNNENNDNNGDSSSDEEETYNFPPSIPPKSSNDYVQKTVAEMREKVFQKTKLTCSAGIAPNSILAKIASDEKKPNGQCFVEAGDSNVMHFLKNLSTRKMGGIGRVSQKTLSAFNINTLGELYERRCLIHQIFSAKSASFLLRASLGYADEDDYGKGEGGGQKSASCESTFRASGDLTILKEHLKRITKTLTERYMVKQDKTRLRGKTITLRVKLSDYQKFCRSKTVGSAVGSYEEIWPVVERLFDAACRDEKILGRSQDGKFECRLLGVAVSSLVAGRGEGEGQQKTLEGLWGSSSSTTTTKTEDVDLEEDLVDDTVSDGDEEVLLSQCSSAGEQFEDDERASLELAKELAETYEMEETKRREDEERSLALAQKLQEEGKREEDGERSLALAMRLEEEEKKGGRINELFGRLKGGGSGGSPKKRKEKEGNGGGGGGGGGIGSFFVKKFKK